MRWASPENTASASAIRLARIAAGIVAAIGLAWLSITVHLQRACEVRDTPYLNICGAPPDESTVQRDLRVRIARNPGDSGAWIQLASLERGEHEKDLFNAAAALAPNEPNVLMWRAGQALAANQPPEAIALLVQLVEYRGKGEAAQTLARLLASGEGTALLRPHLATAGRWLPAVISNLGVLKLPASAAQPLVAEAWAKGDITKPMLQTYIRLLKSQEQWVDAYGLWLAQQQGPVPLVYNGSFEQPFQPDGFDWELTPTLPSRTGATISRRPSGNRSTVLDIQFTGKALVTPILRQQVFAPPGRYVLRGQFMASRLRSEQGMAWAFRCSNKNVTTVAGRSAGLQDTGGVWQPFQFPVVVSSDCGTLVNLQLETFAPFEAAAGITGRMAFDALELVPQRL